MLDNPKARPIVDAYLAPGSTERRALWATKFLEQCLDWSAVAIVTIPVFDIGFNIYKIGWVHGNPVNTQAREICEKEVNDSKEEFKLEKIKKILGGNATNSDKLEAIDETVDGYDYPDNLNRDCDINPIKFPDANYQWLYDAKDLAFRGGLFGLISGIALGQFNKRKTVGTLNKKILKKTVQSNKLINGSEAARFVGLYYDFSRQPSNALKEDNLYFELNKTLKTVFCFADNSSSSLPSLLYAERAKPVIEGLNSAANVSPDDNELLIRAINALTTLTLLSGENEHEKEIRTFLKQKIGYYNDDINREINFHEIVIKACEIDAINNWFKEQFGDDLWNDIKDRLANRQPLTEEQVNVIRILPERTLLVAPARDNLQLNARFARMAKR